MSRVRRGYRVLAAAMAMLVLLAVGGGITASAREKIAREEQEAYCREQEKLLVWEVREYLSEQGYRNSGVTLTRTRYEDGSLEYKLTVHHGKIDSMTEEEREALLKELEEFTFPVENGRFVQEFYING